MYAVFSLDNINMESTIIESMNACSYLTTSYEGQNNQGQNNHNW